MEYQKLSPFLDLEAVREPQGSSLWMTQGWSRMSRAAAPLGPIAGAQGLTSGTPQADYDLVRRFDSVWAAAEARRGPSKGRGE